MLEFIDAVRNMLRNSFDSREEDGHYCHIPPLRVNRGDQCSLTSISCNERELHSLWKKIIPEVKSVLHFNEI